MIDDKELIRKFTSGDEKAFDQIVQKNLNNVFGFFMKITRDEMAAEDLTQDVFLKLYKSLNLEDFNIKKSLVPISKEGIILDGSHRVAAAIKLKKNIYCIRINIKPPIYDQNFFVTYYLYTPFQLVDP